MDDHKLRQLEKLITSLDNQLTADDFEAAFTEVMKVVADAKDALEGRAAEIETTLSKHAAKIADETTKLTKKAKAELVKEVRDTLSDLQKALLDERKAVDAAITHAKSLKAPEIDYSVVAGLIPKVDTSAETITLIDQALEPIEEDIETIQEDIEELKKRPTGNITYMGTGGSSGTSSGGGTWGSITGTLSAQTDLQTALDAKATPADITTAINNLVDTAPGTLDTLNELAAALGDDPNFATTTATALGNKVDKNTSITGATKTKITYDSKGLVTAGADAAIADITGLQAALDAKANDSSVVHIAGTETITGAKTFSESITQANGTLTASEAAGVTTSGDATINVGSVGYIWNLITSSGNVTGWLRAARTAATAYLGVELQSISRDGIRFLTGAASATEVARINAYGQMIVGTTTSTLSRFYVTENTTQTGTAAGATIEQQGAGDAILQFLLTGVRRWVMGVDNSDSDKFKIAANADVGASTLFSLDTSGNTVITGTATASNISGTNTGDQTSIVGITGTTAQFNTALSDGDFATLAGTETLTNKTLTSPTLTTPALGTPSAIVLTNATGTATSLTAGITNALKSATTTVDVSAATAPSSGQILTATSSTAATWQTPAASGSATAIDTTTGNWWNMQIPPSTALASGTPTYTGIIEYSAASDGQALQYYLPNVQSATNDKLLFSNVKRIICRLYYMRTSGTAKLGFGFSDQGSYVGDAVSSAGARVCFTWDNATDLYAVTSDGVGTPTSTSISSPPTSGNWNEYIVDYDVENTSCKFYINGTLKATHTTELPVSSDSCRFVIGVGGSVAGSFSYPIVSIKVV